MTIDLNISQFKCRTCDRISYDIFAKRDDGRALICSQECLNAFKALEKTKGVQSNWHLRRPSLIRQDAEILDIGQILKIQPNAWVSAKEFQPKNKEYVKAYSEMEGVISCRFRHSKKKWIDSEGNKIKVVMWKRY